MRKSLPLLLVVALLVVDGIVYGLWTNRWRSPEELHQAVARVASAPMAVGEWQGEDGKPLSQAEIEAAGFEGNIVRAYRNRVTGQRINVMLACGRPGPLSVHTPDICYRGAGYEVMKSIARRDEQAAEAELWQAYFSKPDQLSPTELRVVWTWNAKGAWEAPANELARFRFAGAPALYKLYVIQEVVPGDRDGADEACAEFLREFLPALNKELFPPRS
jgi:hypothetical protein